MGDVIPFRKPSASQKHKGKTLCKSGFHKWEVVETPFDVRRGKMVTVYQCKRCGTKKTELR